MGTLEKSIYYGVIVALTVFVVIVLMAEEVTLEGVKFYVIK